MSDEPPQSTVLMRCGLPRSPCRLAWHQNSSSSMPLGDRVDCTMNQTHRTSNSTLPNALMGRWKHVMRNTYRGWTGHYFKSQLELKKIWNCWFELATVQSRFGEIITNAAVLDFDNHTWGKWNKIEFRWVVVVQSQMHFMSISAHWKLKKSIRIPLIASNWSVAIFFFPRMYNMNYFVLMHCMVWSPCQGLCTTHADSALTGKPNQTT